MARAALVAVLVCSAEAIAVAAEDVDALIHQAVQLYGQGRYQEAVAMAEKVTALAQRTRGPEHPSTLLSMDNLGFLYDAQGRYSEAEPLLKQVLAIRDRTLGQNHPDTLQSASTLGTLYQAQRRYTESEPLLKRALAGRERALGAAHPDTLRSLGHLGMQYLEQGRYGDAEPLWKRAMTGYEKTVGPDHANTLMSVNNLAWVYRSQGRYGEAEPLMKRVVASRERVLGPDHPDTLQGINNLGALYRSQGRYNEAEPLLLRAVAGRERVLGPEHRATLTSINNLGHVYQAQGRYGAVEPLWKRALAGRERALGPDHPETLQSLSNLAVLYDELGRYGEAEPLLRRALASRERVLGAEHPDTLETLGILAGLYQEQGRYVEAEPLLKRTLASNERMLGPAHPSTLTIASNLGMMFQEQQRYGEAEELFKRVLAARERVLGPTHPDTFQSAKNLGSLYQLGGRYTEAEPLLKRALAGYEGIFEPEHPRMLTAVSNLGALYYAEGLYEEAEPLWKRVLAGRERVFGAEHPDTIGSVNNLAALHFARRDWLGAAAYWQRSAAAIAGRTQRGAQAAGQAVTGKRQSEADQSSWQFGGLVKAVYRLTPEGGTPDAANTRAMFQSAQWARGSETAQALTQMAARGAKGDPELAALVRERQDLVSEWQKRELARSAALSQETAKRDAKTEAANNAKMAAIDQRLAAIDKRLSAAFPDYAALASAGPLSVEDVQALLGADEALVLFLDTPAWQPTPEETFIWVVTKTQARWVRSNLGTGALTREVVALRCGLDQAAWKWAPCKELTGVENAQADASPGAALPFDHVRAHQLYEALFGQIADLIKGKQLLLVPSGPLTQLPFQVLITAPPARGDHRSAAWLVRGHNLTVLPAVSSLKALRRVGHPSAAPKPLIGFGNPLLDGNDGQGLKLARRAREKQECANIAGPRLAALSAAQPGAAPIRTRGGLADVALIRAQMPLPETADELCAVARAIGADVTDIRLGAHASEREVKAASESGELAKYRIVHFATHGVMAGELRTDSEPGLILTPPAKASAEDDGYLTASEIAALKLDADWVILSACNTAAGDAPSAEALSGLARAFIYAQARALLVSHWAVYSDAAVKLISTAMREIARDKTAGRAEALRRAMLALIDKGDPREAHPAYWAPFIVVGEGRR